MSPTKSNSRSRAGSNAGSNKSKAAKPPATKRAGAAAGKAAKPRTRKSAAPIPVDAAQQQLPIELPIPTRQDAPAKLRVPAPAAVAATQEAEERRRRGILLLIIVPLLMLGSFWIGRLTTPVAATGTGSATPSAATSASTPAQTTRATVATPGGSTAASNTRPGRETTLLEVSVGTTSRGGLTLRFDHPVDWKVNGALGGAEAELDVHGVRAPGTFPRNLPLPPGVTAIRAGITAPDILNLKFELQPGIRIFAVPAAGPAAALTIYFRTPAEEALASSSTGAGDAGACGAQLSPETAKAITLLQQSLDKNPGYEAVRQTLALLETCAGDGAKAEQLLGDGAKTGGNAGVKLAVTDAALRYARGDIDGALKSLKSSAPAGTGDPGYLEVMADLQAARQP